MSDEPDRTPERARRLSHRRVVGIVAGLVFVLVASITQVSSAAESTSDRGASGRCAAAPLHVALDPATPADQVVVAGTRCEAARGVRFGAKLSTVDVLVPGATYTARDYWDVDEPGMRLSFVQRDLSIGGRDVFYYDPPGVGRSSVVDSAKVTMDANAFVLHEVIASLRRHYRHVNIIGHSFGSLVAVREDAQFHDADLEVLTGALHSSSTALLTGHPALGIANQQDPKWAGYDDGWRTTLPGERGYFQAPTVSPSLMAFDEAHKSVISFTEYTEGRAQRTAPLESSLTQQMTGRVMLIFGSLDGLYCVGNTKVDCADVTSVKTFEAGYYQHVKSLTVVSVSGAGHDVTLGAPQESFHAIDDFLDHHGRSDG